MQPLRWHRVDSPRGVGTDALQGVGGAGKVDEDLQPSPSPGLLSGFNLFAELTGTALMIAYLATGAAIVLVILIPMGWWSEASGTLRDLLEALPFGGAVADEPSERGNPVLIGVLAGVAVAAAILAATRWRRRAARDYLTGSVSIVQLYAISVARTVAIFGGITLVPILVVIARGNDLRDEPETTFTGPIPVVVVLVVWAVYSYFGLSRLVAREAATRPRPAAAPSPA